MYSLLFASFILLLAAQSSDAGCGCPNMGKRMEKGNDTHPVIVGDMALVGKDDEVFQGSRASISERYRWPGGRVYYTYGSAYTADQKKFIRESLDVLSKMSKGCVSFVDVSGKQLPSNYLSVISGQGCVSFVGNVKRGQTLSLNRDDCIQDQVVQHEFMHALGFYHEQSRPDRDSYINVHWQNIDSRNCGNFNKCNGCSTRTSYDINSVMQYGGDIFSCGSGRPTMTNKNGQMIAYNSRLTKLDLIKLMSYYGCSPSPNMAAYKKISRPVSQAQIKQYCGSVGGFSYFSKDKNEYVYRCYMTDQELWKLCPRAGGSATYNYETGMATYRCN